MSARSPTPEGDEEPIGCFLLLCVIIIAVTAIAHSCLNAVR